MSLPGGDRSTIESTSTFVYDKPLPIKYSPAPEKVLNFDPKKIIPGKSRPDPQKNLFDKELIYSWPHKSMASGLVNLRNTCFLASVVQCLQHIPALNRYLLVHHRSSCEDANHKCIICMVKRLAEDCFRSMEPVEPKELAYNLQEIAPHLIRGRQEDAHEFLHSLLNRMQDDLTYNINPKPDQSEEMTTPIGLIFGGFLRSQIVCLGCNRASNSYESLLSISLEIKSAGSLLQALDSFVHPEDMGGDEWYSCETCKVKRRAIKSYSIDTPPKTLIVHLKRYNQEDRFQSKLSHHVQFDERLDLKPYISPESTCRARATYELCSVLVHLGNHVGAGHYYSYVADPNTFDHPQKRSWYVMNDDAVSPTHWGRVRDSEAYLLFYIRTDCKPKKVMDKKPVFITKILPRCTVLLKHLKQTTESNGLSPRSHPLSLNGPGPADCLLKSTSSLDCNKSPDLSFATGEPSGVSCTAKLIENGKIEGNTNALKSIENRESNQVHSVKRKVTPSFDCPKRQKLSNGFGPEHDLSPPRNHESSTVDKVKSPTLHEHACGQLGDGVKNLESSSLVAIRRHHSDLSHNRRADSHSRCRDRSRRSGSRNSSSSRRKRRRSRSRHDRSRSRGLQNARRRFSRSRSRSRDRHRPRHREDSRGFRRHRTHERWDERRRHRHHSSGSSCSNGDERKRRSRERNGERRRSSRRHRHHGRRSSRSRS